MVKWCDCICASGHVMPMCMIFDGFSKEHDMPMDDFHFLSIEGLAVNAHLDVRSNNHPGYIVLKRTGAPMEKFHAWYEDTILYPYFLQLRESRGLLNHDNIPESEWAVVYFDSDMTNIKYAMNPAVMERNMLRGIRYNKIAAKATHKLQPADLGDAFKTKKLASKAIIATPEDQALQCKVAQAFQYLDGCYVMYDSVRKTLIRAGMASETFARRLFKDHPKSAMINTPVEKTRRFYLKYPKKVSAYKVPEGIQKGIWEDLEMRLGIGMSKQHKQQILDMFEWNEIDENYLTKLKYSSSGGGTIVDKRWKHLCYCFETFMAVAIAPGDNVTEAPTMEWQLQL